MCGVEDRVDLFVYVYWVQFMVSAGLWVEFGVFVTFISELG